MQYKKYGVVFAIFLIFMALLTAYLRNTTDEQISSSRTETVTETVEKGQAATKESVTEAIADTEISTDAPGDTIKISYTADTKVWDVMDDPAVKGYGRLIFLTDQTIDRSMTLRDVSSILPWYNYVNPERTVEIVNYMKTKAEAGEQIFYDIYTDEEKAADPAKKNTGLFFLRDKQKHEVDFLVVIDEVPVALIEVKNGGNEFSPHLFYFQRYFQKIPSYQVVYNLQRSKQSDNIKMIEVDKFLAEMPIN